MQETLLAMHLKRDTWDEARPIEPWLRAIARHKLVDHLRRRGFPDHVDIDDHADAPELAVDVDAAASASTRGSMLASLPERQRRIVQEISLEGTARRRRRARLGMSEGAVRVTLAPRAQGARRLLPTRPLMKTEQLVEGPGRRPRAAGRQADRPRRSCWRSRSAAWCRSCSSSSSSACARTSTPALATWRFDLKVGMVLVALVLAFGLCLDARGRTRPAAPMRRLLPLAVLAVAAVAVELAIVPRATWGTRLVGSNSLVCLSAIPMLSIAPLAAVLAILRAAAPASPALAGAAAGLLAAASGATLYAFHCFDDSPLFVVTWYSLAAIPIVLIGALVGRWLLRW